MFNRFWYLQRDSKDSVKLFDKVKWVSDIDYTTKYWIILLKLKNNYFIFYLT